MSVLCQIYAPDVPIIVDYLCTGSFDSELNEKCFDVMEGIHIRVLNRKEQGNAEG